MDLVPGSLLAQRYRAESLLGRGGMGEVWRCRDEDRGDEVAVKVLHAAGLDPRRRRLFRDEIVATAHLDHPGIVRVYDVIQEADNLALVMELELGRPLSKIDPLPFAEFRDLAIQVLEALAYAHARGVLHLDVKPSNVIVSGRPAGLRATLVDFGVARGWRQGEDLTDDTIVRGTLGYMAPEQIFNTPGGYGPWTDLYAFGVLLYELIAGTKPFASRSPIMLAVTDPPPLDTARCGLDPMLGTLITQLLSQRPEARPSHAADVIRVLRALDPKGTVGATVREEAGPTAETSVTPVRSQSERARDSAPPEARRWSSWWPEPPSRSPRRTRPPARPPPPPGSYALVGLREMPVLGRESEQRTIWTELCEASQSDEPRVILLRGPPGCGHSRLASDALERAHESGLAHTAWTAWSQGGADGEGIRRFVESAVASDGSTGRGLAEHLERWCARYGGDARFRTDLRLLLDPGAGATDADLPFRVAAECVERLAADRLVAVWLDDVQWGGQAAMLLVQRLRSLAAPVAIVATGDAAIAGKLTPHREVVVAPLSDDATADLIRGQLDVTGPLLDALVARSAGHSLFAHQLVADLVESDQLERVAGQFQLRTDVSLDDLPASLDDLWQRRLARAGGEANDLAVLALLRPRVDTELVAHLLAHRGASFADTLERGLRAGLLRRSKGFIQWSHGLLREHVASRIAPADRPRVHRAAAEALAVLVGKQDVQSERAHHLHAAGDLEAACAALTDGLAWSHRVGDAEARRLRATTLEAWARAGSLPHYEARALAEHAHIHATERDPEAARAAIERARIVEASAEAPSAWLAFRAAQVATARGEVDDARGEAERALELARARGLDDVTAQALGHLALDAYRRRDLESARRQFEEVVTLARSLGDGVTEAKALVHLGNLAPTESLDLLARAVVTAQAAGAVLVELSARQVHADALFELGRRAEAMAELGEVNTHARARGARQHASVVAIQLACWQLWEGAVTEAAKALGQAKEQGAPEGSRVERCMVAALEAAIAAAEGDEEAARSALDQLAAARGDLDVPDLRKVLAWGRARADADLAARFATALD